MTILKHATGKNVLGVSCALILGGSLLLTGCSSSANGESPTGGSSTASSSSGSASSVASSAAAGSSAVPQEATPTSPAKNIPEPVMPAAAKENSAKGLEAFTRYWFEVNNVAQKTGDTKQLLSLCVKDSPYCSERKKSIDQFSEREAWMTGGEAKIGSFFTQMKETSGGYVHGLIELDQSARTVYQASGHVPEADLPARKASLEVFSKWNGSEWKFLGPKPIEGAEYSK